MKRVGGWPVRATAGDQAGRITEEHDAARYERQEVRHDDAGERKGRSKRREAEPRSVGEVQAAGVKANAVQRLNASETRKSTISPISPH